MDNKEAIRLEDGRKADRIVREELNETGEAVTVTELFVEPKIEKKLAKRIVEYTRPVIHRREIETVDETTGNVVEKKVESIDPSVKMELREHVVSAPKLEAQSYVTHTELKDLILTLKTNPIVTQATEAEKFFDVEQPTKSQQPKKIQMQEIVKERVEEAQNPISMGSMILMAIIVAEIAFGLWYYWN